MSAVPTATRGLFCDNQPIGQATRGFFCDPVVVVPPDPRVNRDTGQGRSQPITVRNVMARLVANQPARSDYAKYVTPYADALTKVIPGDYSTTNTVNLQPTSDAIISVTGYPLDAETVDVMASAGAYAGVAGYANGVDNTDATPEATAVAGLQRNKQALTAKTAVEPTGIENPTEEQIISIIRSRRRRKNLKR